MKRIKLSHPSIENNGKKMRNSSTNISSQIQETIDCILPLDAKEEEHIVFTNSWIASGAPLFREKSPNNPDPHLVVYFLVLDPTYKKILLVDHKKASLWLPPGGHVEFDEHPKEAVKRESLEELSLQADFILEHPFFLTATKTAGKNFNHTDVSLWYLLKGSIYENYDFSAEEFHKIRWFSPEEIPYERSDPHMQRSINKIKTLHLL